MKNWLLLSCLWLVGCAGFQGVQLPTHEISSAEQLGVSGLEFSPDGQHFATSSVRGEVTVWSYPGKQKKWTFWEHAGRVQSIHWAGNEKLITGGNDRKIILYDLQAGTVTATELQLNSTINSLGFLASKNCVVSGHLDGTVRVHTLPDLKFINSFETDETVMAVAVSSKGVIASAGDGGQTLLFESDLNKPREITRSSRDAAELRFSRDGQKLLGSGWKLLIWDVTSGQLTMRDTGHIGAFSSVDISPDYKYYATIGCSADARVQLFDFKTGEVARQLAPHNNCGTSVRFTPNGQFVVSAAEDERVRFFDITIPYKPEMMQNESSSL